MNLKNILKDNGYEIVREVGMKYLRIKITQDELQRRLQLKEFYDFDLEGEFNVEVKEVGFNGYGNLYIVLDCIDDEHFKKGDCFDVIKY